MKKSKKRLIVSGAFIFIVVAMVILFSDNPEPRGITIRSSIAGKSAAEICAKFPNEPVCKSWKEGQECLKNDECGKEVEDGSFYASADDVLDCFVSPKHQLPADYPEKLPCFCDRYRFLPISVVGDLPSEVAKYADQVSPGHIAGLAKGVKLIVENYPELREEFEEIIPTLEQVIATGGDDESAINQSAGIVIGLFNGLIGMAKNHVEISRSINARECEAWRGGEVIPIRCYPQK